MCYREDPEYFKTNIIFSFAELSYCALLRLRHSGQTVECKVKLICNPQALFLFLKASII